MPFQGNPNAGAPNVELLRFLADQKATRAKLAFEQQKAQIEAMRQAKEDARAEAKFQIEMANAMETQRQQRIKTAQDMQGLLGSIGSRAEAVPAGQRQEAQSQQFFGSVGDGDQQLGQDFAAAVLPNDPNAFNEELALASTLTGDRNLDRDVSQAAALGGISRADVLGGAQTELNVRDLAAKRELDKTTAAEQRQEDKERRARIHEDKLVTQRQKTMAALDESIALRRDVREVETVNRAIRSKAKAADKARKDGNEEMAAILEEDVKGLVARRDADLTRGQPDQLIKVREKIQGDSFALDQLAFSSAQLAAFRDDVRSLGTEAAVSAFVSNAVNVAGDLGVAILPSVNEFIETGNSSADEKEKIRRLLIDGVDEDNTRISAARLAEVRARWQLLNAVGRDRVSNMQLTDIKDPARFTGFFTSDKRARENLNATIVEFENNKEALQRSILLLSPESEFSEDGRLIIRGSGGTPFNERLQPIFGGGAATQPVPQEESVSDVLDSIVEEAMRAAGNPNARQRENK